MGYCHLEFRSLSYLKEPNRNKVKQFEEKWKEIIKLFEGNFFITDNKGNYYLFCLPKYDVSINSRNFNYLDNGKPNRDRALARFFSNIKKSIGNTDFGFGTLGFADEFYEDLYELCNGDYTWEVLSVDCGDGGYYTGSFTLIESGISESFEFNKFLEE